MCLAKLLSTKLFSTKLIQTFCFFFVVGIFVTNSRAADAIEGKKFHALLVGCTKYDNLDPSKWLNGPANDVDLVRRFFTEHLQLPAQSIVVLSETEATAHGESFRPTRTNIGREIQKLIDTAQDGDQVVLLLAGHGGQQPEQKTPDPTYLKPDGLDQMFLPCDCGHWSGKKWCVENAIADYELRNWCKQITFKKARLWVVLDACCSGWTLRDNSVKRNLSTDDLGIPKADLAKSQTAAAARGPANRGAEGPRDGGATPESVSVRGADASAPAFDFGPQSPDYVGIYAAQRDESELEMPMPFGGDEKQPQRVQGLLTYAIVDILSRTSRPITYGELANLVRQRYPQWGRTTGPTPVVEGRAQDRVVLGVRRWPGRSQRQWKKDEAGALSANEGSVEGLTPGTILALYPSADQPHAETVIGYAKVRNCELLDSDLALTKHAGLPLARKSSLPAGGCFEVAWTDYGSLRLKLSVELQPVYTDSPTNSAPTAAAIDERATAKLQRLAGELKTALATDGSLCELADDPRAAQWVIQMRDGKLILVSKDAADIRGPFLPETPRFSVPESDTVTEIVHDMTRIARAQNLLNLTKADQDSAGHDSASQGGANQPVGDGASALGNAVADDASRPNVRLKIVQYASKTDPRGKELDPAKAPLVFLPGDFVGWRITNQGKTDVAVSLLYIDAGFGIHAIYPRAGSGTDNILTKNGGFHATKPAKITADPVGNEHIVLIAVPRQAGRQPPDFSFLEQPTLPKSRGDGSDNPGLDSPLGQLLKNALYGDGKTRGMESGDAAEAHLMLQSWRVSSAAE